MSIPEKELDTSTTMLRAEILLLSSYYNGYETTSTASHPKDPTWPLFADLSTLLTTGDSSHPEAQNVNAVTGSATIDIVERIIFNENARQSQAKVDLVQNALCLPTSGAVQFGYGLSDNPLVEGDHTM